MKNKKILNKYKRCIYEYTNAAGTFDINEDGEMDMPQDNDNSMQQGMGDEIPQDLNQDNMEMEPTNDMGGELDDNDMNSGVENFNPEGENQEGIDTMEPDDEVIDVDDLTQSQESAEKKIDAMNSKFDKLMGAVEVLINQNKMREKEIEEIGRKTIEYQEKLSNELDKRIPTPQQRMTMRSTKSAPYSMTPNEYMNNYAPDNYSDENDNNGADDAQYQITKDDIDNFRDFSSVAKELDIEHQGLNDILDIR